MSDSLRPHGLQHARLLCLSLSPSLLKSRSLESVMLSKHLFLYCPFLLLPSIFPRIRVFSNEWALYIRWYIQYCIGASASVLQVNIQGWFPLGLTGLTSLQAKELSRVFSSSTIWKHETRWQYTALMYSFPNFEPVSCSMEGSSCCFLTHIQVSQETGKVVWYYHFPQFVVINTVKGSTIVN